jgi:adenine-specific DNA glycosylase
MNTTTTALQALFNRIPRRHSLENVKDIYGILTEYEDLLIKIEAVNPFYEKNIPVFFDELEQVRSTIKKSTDNKASKKNKDSLFDEGSGSLKDSMQALMDLYAGGNRVS